MGNTEQKHRRHEYILKKIDENPFLKDSELAEEFGVSVATIRIDRAELGISQYRDRIKDAAENAANNTVNEELLDLNLFKEKKDKGKVVEKEGQGAGKQPISKFAGKTSVKL